LTRPVNEDELLAQLLEALARAGLVGAAQRVEAAFRLAALAHTGQERSCGLPYLVHPVGVARILLEEWGVTDPDLVAAGLLHDAVEDAEAVDLPAVEAAAGARVREVVDHLTKPPLAEGQAKADRDAAYFRRLGAGPADAVLVKAADRLDNLRSLLTARWPEAKKRGYVAEATDAILPLVRGPWPDAAARLEAEATDVLARIDRGEGDLPDVGPTDEARGIGVDPLLRRSRHLSRFRHEGSYFLYHDLVGDILQLHPRVFDFLDYFEAPRRESEARAAWAEDFAEGDLDAFFQILGQHLCLVPEGEDDEALVATWHPVRGPWILCYRPEGAPMTLCYRDRETGEVVLEAPAPLQAALFALCDGDLSTDEIVARIRKRFPDADVEAEVRGTLAAWTHSRRQLLKLLPRPKRSYEMVGLPAYVHSTMPYERIGGSAPEALADERSLRDYHELAIESAEEQFEVRETTINHALRVPHPALGGKTYGARLVEGLLAREVVRDDGGRGPYRVVEVGGGTGRFAKAFLEGLAVRAPRVYNRLRYAIVELSPALRRAQGEQAAGHQGKARVLGGDAQRLPVADGAVDCLVCNEVIADLPVVEVDRHLVDTGAGRGPGYDELRRFGLRTHDAPGRFPVNTGALRFLEEVARVLAPGGTAYVSEYGSLTRYPERSSHLDHAEHSIHFGHLQTAARALGLEVTLEELPAVLDLDGAVEVLKTTQSSFAALKTFLARRGVTLEKIAYTRDMLQDLVGDEVDLDRLEGLVFSPCGERLLGLDPRGFKALLVRKPVQTGRSVDKVEIDF